MNLTLPQQQLANLSVQSIMGVSAEDSTFPEKASELASQIWSEFIDEEITDLLTDEQLVELGELLENEDTTEQQFVTFLNDAVPNFEEMYEEKILENKAVLVEGRINQLRVFSEGETDKQLLLDNCEELIDKGEWLQVESILATEFAGY